MPPIPRPLLPRGPATALVGALLLLTACSGPSGPGGPAAPYDHGPMHETSVAGPVALGGEVGTIAEGLRGQGLSCAQVRANEVAVQVWCHRDVDVEPTVFADATEDVDLVGTPHGDLAWARVEFGRALPGHSAPSLDDADPFARLQALLDTSFLHVWPAAREDLAELLVEVQTAGRDMTGERDGPATVHTGTGSADWSVTEPGSSGPVELVVRTDRLRNSTWPYAADSYATTVTEAATVLTAAGMDCFGDLCRRFGGGDEISFTPTRASPGRCRTAGRSPRSPSAPAVSCTPTARSPGPPREPTVSRS